MPTPLFIATERFDPSDGEKWQKYCDWAKIPGLVEVVSLDAMLCKHLIKEFQDEDWSQKKGQSIGLVSRSRPATFSNSQPSFSASRLPPTSHRRSQPASLRTPDSVENHWTRFAMRLAMTLPLPGERAGVRGNFLGHRLSTQLRFHDARSGVLSLGTRSNMVWLMLPF